MTKIEKIITWQTIKDGLGTSVAETYYNNGNVKRYYESYSQDWPKSVHNFIDNHEKRKLNSQCNEYI